MSSDLSDFDGADSQSEMDSIQFDDAIGDDDDDQDLMLQDESADSDIIEDDGDEDDDSGAAGFSPVDDVVKGKQKHARSNNRPDELANKHGVEYSVMSADDLHNEQKRAVDYVKDMLSLKPEDAAVLLRYFAWKKDKLVETYMDDSSKTLQKAGIQEGGAKPRLKRVRGFVCQVCFDEGDQLETIALSCDHRYCRECYSHYVSSKINDEGESRHIQCMGSKCNVIIDEATIALLVEPDVYAKYRTLLNRTYVDDDPHLKWCPAPNCEYAISCSVPPRALDVTIPTVSCACGNTFCFGCGDDDHRPCCCPIKKRWLKKCADDSETSNWISANTKECTKCHSTIEKNGGCNHMTCKKCHWEFCWICLGPWSEHGTAYYNCSRYQGKDEKHPDGYSKSRESLQRYLHYYNRYANHEQSIKLEKELVARSELKMNEMLDASTLSWIEVQFLAKAVEVLSKARTVLKWTYAMAFYLERNNQTYIFEDNQNDLEQAVEALAELVERPVEPETIAELRQQTTDKTVYVSRRVQVLLDDTLSGYEEERWVWAEPIKNMT